MATTGRRAEYAAATRRAILDAARDLFIAQGYARTTIEDIAANARVAPATVYAVGGGKKGLLNSTVEEATTAAGVQEAYAMIVAHPDADRLLEWIVHETRTRFETWSDLMRVVTDAAPNEPAAAAALDRARSSLRGALARTAARLDALGRLRADVDVDHATDVLWFHLGNSAYFTLTLDNGWSLDRAEGWLLDSLRRALL
jgi:AcrR family transcriptional regulator